MIAVIFEVCPRPGSRQQYLDIAAALRLVDSIDGLFLSNVSKAWSQPDKLLSLSFWRDDEAVAQWRGLEPHRQAQSKGREAEFEDYRLRIAGVVRDYGLHEREEAPADSRLRNG